MISVVIPSRNPVNLAACTAAVKKNEPDVEIICVWDMSRGNQSLAPQYFTVIEVEAESFVFSRNVNIGIRHAMENPSCEGVVILGDDGLLESPKGFKMLARAHELYPDYGIIAAATNNAGNRNQFPQGLGLREESRMVCFVAVFMPRKTIETVGLLDEDFVGYGFEDDSYSLRVRRAGLKIGIHDFVHVDHRTLKSTFRGPQSQTSQQSCREKFELNRSIFIQKYGAHPL